MKRLSKLRWSAATSWTCAAAIVGIAAAYTPALGNGTTWSLPYSGSYSSSGAVFSMTNTGSGFGISGLSANLGILGNGTASGSVGVEGLGYGTGVFGAGVNSAGTGVRGDAGGSSGYGVMGVNGIAAVYGFNSAANTYGVEGVAGNGTGMYGTGVTGVYGSGSCGVYGYCTANSAGSGVFGSASGFNEAVYGYATSGATGVYASSDSGTGVYGGSSSGNGVFGYGAAGVYGESSGEGENNAGHFQGNVLITGNLQVNGTINKSAVGFKIDHPLDPAHKYLMHSCVESDEMMNIYRGNVIVDSNGKAVVIMPDWFQAENRDFSYQLTPIGAPAPGIYVSREIEQNQFEIAGGSSGMKISWQVTGARNDRYALAHPLAIEPAKRVPDVGKFIRPEEFGQPQSKMIGYTVAEHSAPKLPVGPRITKVAPPQTPPAGAIRPGTAVTH
jgi:hypothetical protein